MVPASASARRSTPASRDPALSEGTKDAEGGGGRDGLRYEANPKANRTATRDDQHTSSNSFDSYSM
ncbi:hypothetical protein ALC53_03816 [Atta colombica]|uniref:Uncharacterized protein n=1 Tax=Atta colombica TaxID=520822 RepID=A0A195BN88_9HYME|nr:hypothetical protein ALC53_03816 [Atta colombica]